ncbi:MAG: GxxExxY protein [Acidobacteria bacterium]|nr:GxxExxY protein [Acidobacteriota bacterium]
MSINDLTENIIGAAIEVHRAIGPGLLESAYEECLCHELRLRRVPLVRQFRLPIIYKGLRLDCGYRLDLLADNKVVIEIKAVAEIQLIHQAQLLSYLRLGHWSVELLINFHVPVLKQGITRLVSNFQE